MLRWLGHCVSSKARIQISIVLVDHLYMQDGAQIGHFNLINIYRLIMRKNSRVGNFNIVRGQFSVSLGRASLIGNRNLLGGGRKGSALPVNLRIGAVAGFTAQHYINLNASIYLGDYSTLAGAGSQIWTHGYVHMLSGPGREEVRGKVTIGNNVYIGSMSCIGPGITIVDGASIGAHSSVSTSLMEPGVYVSQKLRYVAKMPEVRLASLQRIEEKEVSYRWRDGGGAWRGRPLI